MSMRMGSIEIEVGGRSHCLLGGYGINRGYSGVSLWIMGRAKGLQLDPLSITKDDQSIPFLLDQSAVAVEQRFSPPPRPQILKLCA